VFLSSPIIPKQKKQAIIAELFASRVSATTMRFLNLLVNKGRESILADIIRMFYRLRDDKFGIVNANVIVAAPIAPEQEQTLQQSLERYTHKTVHMRFNLDKSIQGGLVVQVGDTVLDGSIRRQLQLLREKFSQGSEVRN
jgi:F-type H+-transporting ATPase subunit delta